MPVTVKIKRFDEVVVTSANEAAVLGEEWDRRYSNRPFEAGDTVEYTANGRQRHLECFGFEHVGKRGIVTTLSDNGDDVKVLAISTAGEFVELWTPEAILVRVD